MLADNTLQMIAAMMPASELIRNGLRLTRADEKALRDVEGVTAKQAEVSSEYLGGAC